MSMVPVKIDNHLQAVNCTMHVKRMLCERSASWGHSQHYFKDNPFVAKHGAVLSTMVNITFILPLRKG